MSSLSTHVLDSGRGIPAAGIAVTITVLGNAAAAQRTLTTDEGGRIGALLTDAVPGRYRLSYDLGPLGSPDHPSLYPWVEIEVEIDPDRHHHVVLTLSPGGYFVACVPG